jgi:hypothetical protein
VKEAGVKQGNGQRNIPFFEKMDGRGRFIPPPARLAASAI